MLHLRENLEDVMKNMLVLAVVFWGMGCAAVNVPAELSTLEGELRATEIAFAQTMADRDFAAFESYLAPDTIFFAGESVLRGSGAVAAAWKPLFDGARAPFSWAPVTVAVQDGGQLALSSGPVLDANAKQIGVFNSIWRREPDGSWKIIFDKGGEYCPSGDD
jgi:ketosteroid isomerase-like protein